MKGLHSRHSNPDRLILNFDPTPLSYVYASNHTLHQKGASSVPLLGKGKQKRITGTFTMIKSGDFLPMQLIYEGKASDLSLRGKTARRVEAVSVSSYQLI